MDSNRLRQRLLGYVVAAASVGAVVALRLSLSVAVEDSYAFPLFMGAVMVSSWFGGVGPGLVCTVVSALAGSYFFAEPRFSFHMSTAGQRLEIFLFLIEGILVTVLAGMLHRARNDALAGQERARDLQRQLLRVGDDERRRLGHDLHDGLGQQLTGVALLSKALTTQLSARHLENESAQAQQITTLANDIISQARYLARGLDPAPVQPDDLARTLIELCDSSSRVFHVECNCDADPDAVPNDAAAAMHLFRIAQEAVSNAIKHGKARNIDIELQQKADQIVLSVSNDGLPFRAPDETTGKGMGMHIMRHRAKMIGATFGIAPDTSGKTRLTCALPIDAE